MGQILEMKQVRQIQDRGIHSTFRQVRDPNPHTDLQPNLQEDPPMDLQADLQMDLEADLQVRTDLQPDLQVHKQGFEGTLQQNSSLVSFQAETSTEREKPMGGTCEQMKLLQGSRRLPQGPNV